MASHLHKKQKAPGTCIFCGEDRLILSGEHIWPKWAHEFLPDSKIAYHRAADIVFEKEMPDYVNMTLDRRHGAIKHMRIFVVCESCNTKWMSGIENAVRPILIPILRGERIALDRKAQQTLAEWIALKVLVIDQHYPDKMVIPKAERDAFMVLRIIPPNFSIWIGVHNTTRWRSAFQRISFPLALVPVGFKKPTEFEARQTTQTTALGIGSFFAWVLIDKTNGLNLNDRLHVGPGLPRLWPFRDGVVNWPSQWILSDVNIAGMNQSLHAFIDMTRAGAPGSVLSFKP